MKTFFVYIITNRKDGTLYIGITNSLERRVIEHKNKQSNFSSKYNLNKLVYYEDYTSIHDAIKREKQLKQWKRAWKVALIEKDNPEWYDLCV